MHQEPKMESRFGNCTERVKFRPGLIDTTMYDTKIVNNAYSARGFGDRIQYSSPLTAIPEVNELTNFQTQIKVEGQSPATKDTRYRRTVDTPVNKDCFHRRNIEKTKYVQENDCIDQMPYFSSSTRPLCIEKSNSHLNPSPDDSLPNWSLEQEALKSSPNIKMEEKIYSYTPEKTENHCRGYVTRRENVPSVNSFTNKVTSRFNGCMSNSANQGCYQHDPDRSSDLVVMRDKVSQSYRRGPTRHYNQERCVDQNEDHYSFRDGQFHHRYRFSGGRRRIWPIPSGYCCEDQYHHQRDPAHQNFETFRTNFVSRGPVEMRNHVDLNRYEVAENVANPLHINARNFSFTQKVKPTCTATSSSLSPTEPSQREFSPGPYPRCVNEEFTRLQNMEALDGPNYPTVEEGYPCTQGQPEIRAELPEIDEDFMKTRMAIPRYFGEGTDQTVHPMGFEIEEIENKNIIGSITPWYGSNKGDLQNNQKHGELMNSRTSKAEEIVQYVLNTMDQDNRKDVHADSHNSGLEADLLTADFTGDKSSYEVNTARLASEKHPTPQVLNRSRMTSLANNREPSLNSVHGMYSKSGTVEVLCDSQDREKSTKVVSKKTNQTFPLSTGIVSSDLGNIDKSDLFNEGLSSERRTCQLSESSNVAHTFGHGFAEHCHPVGHSVQQLVNGSFEKIILTGQKIPHKGYRQKTHQTLDIRKSSRIAEKMIKDQETKQDTIQSKTQNSSITQSVRYYSATAGKGCKGKGKVIVSIDKTTTQMGVGHDEVKEPNSPDGIAKKYAGKGKVIGSDSPRRSQRIAEKMIKDKETLNPTESNRIAKKNEENGKVVGSHSSLKPRSKVVGKGKQMNSSCSISKPSTGKGKVMWSDNSPTDTKEVSENTHVIESTNSPKKAEVVTMRGKVMKLNSSTAPRKETKGKGKVMNSKSSPTQEKIAGNRDKVVYDSSLANIARTPTKKKVMSNSSPLATKKEQRKGKVTETNSSPTITKAVTEYQYKQAKMSLLQTENDGKSAIEISSNEIEEQQKPPCVTINTLTENKVRNPLGNSDSEDTNDRQPHCLDSGKTERTGSSPVQKSTIDSLPIANSRKQNKKKKACGYFVRRSPRIAEKILKDLLAETTSSGESESTQPLPKKPKGDQLETIFSIEKSTVTCAVLTNTNTKISSAFENNQGSIDITTSTDSSPVSRKQQDSSSAWDPLESTTPTSSSEFQSDIEDAPQDILGMDVDAEALNDERVCAKESDNTVSGQHCNDVQEDKSMEEPVPTRPPVSEIRSVNSNSFGDEMEQGTVDDQEDNENTTKNTSSKASSNLHRTANKIILPSKKSHKSSKRHYPEKSRWLRELAILLGREPVIQELEDARFSRDRIHNKTTTGLRSRKSDLQKTWSKVLRSKSSVSKQEEAYSDSTELYSPNLSEISHKKRVQRPMSEETREAPQAQAKDVGKKTTTRTEGSEENNQSSPEKKEIGHLGDLVWGKFGKSGWWPGIIVNGDLVGRPAAGLGQCWIFWFGDHKLSQIPISKLRHFVANYGLCVSTTKSETYRRSKLEAMKVCQERAGIDAFSDEIFLQQWAEEGFLIHGLPEPEIFTPTTGSEIPPSVSVKLDKLKKQMINLVSSEETDDSNDDTSEQLKGPLTKQYPGKGYDLRSYMRKKERMNFFIISSDSSNAVIYKTERKSNKSQRGGHAIKKHKTKGKMKKRETSLKKREIIVLSTDSDTETPQKQFHQNKSRHRRMLYRRHKNKRKKLKKYTEVKKQEKIIVVSSDCDSEHPTAKRFQPYKYQNRILNKPKRKIGFNKLKKVTTQERIVVSTDADIETGGGQKKYNLRERGIMSLKISQPRVKLVRLNITDYCKDGRGEGTGKENVEVTNKKGEFTMREKALDAIWKGEGNIDDICLRCGSTLIACPHPLFKGGLCGSCKSLLQDRMFTYGEDNQNAYCAICGGGKTLVLCDEEHCPRVFCMGCIELLVGEKEAVLNTSPWFCYLCTTDGDCHGILQRRDNWRQQILAMYNPDGSLLQANIKPAKTKGIRVLSLFDGIGTGRLVLANLKVHVEVYYASEVDESSMLVTQVRHGDGVIQLGDVTGITMKKLEEISPIDLLIGGPPCNDLSIVNPARKGLEGQSGVLFFEFSRILSQLRIINKGHHLHFLMENVASMATMAKDVISRYLGCEPAVYDAKNFSPQRRKRLFWGNIPGLYCPAKFKKSDLQKVLMPTRRKKLDIVNCVTTNTNSLVQKQGIKPIRMADSVDDVMWVPEIEQLFGYPAHFTDVGNLSAQKRRVLLGRAWSVPVVEHLLKPLTEFFELEDEEQIDKSFE